MLRDLTPNIAEIQEDHAEQPNIKDHIQSHIHCMTKIGVMSHVAMNCQTEDWTSGVKRLFMLATFPLFMEQL